MNVRARSGLVLVLAVVALATACEERPRPAAGPGPASPPAPRSTAAVRGLSTSTAFVTVRRRNAVRLGPDASGPILDQVWEVLGVIPAVTPQPGGPRLLANLRINEDLVDVTIWRTQDLDVAGQRLYGVSGIVIPFTGPWRHRVLIVQRGQVEASPTLADSPELGAIERAVDAARDHL